MLAAALTALAAAVALVAAPAARAHAVLLTSAPQAGAVLEDAPKAIVLYFNEPVETAFGAVRVYDGEANRVDSGEISQPESHQVAVAIDRPLARGTYTVTWRVVSADSHPVHGAFVFHVGSPGTNPGGIAAQVLEGGTPRSVSVVFAVVRFLDFALLLACAGGAAALATFLTATAPALRRRLLVVLAGVGGALVLVALVGIAVQGAAAGGFGLGESLTWDVYSTVLDTRFGEIWLIQAAAAAWVAVAALVARRRPLAILASLPAAAIVTATPALAGHGSVRGAVALVADVVHVAAAAVWTGGLAFLAVALVWAGAERWPLAARLVPRFSLLAVGAVSALIVAGVVNGYEEVGAWRGLWETRYGQLLLAKLALVAPLLLLGLFNNRYSVPRLRRGIASAVERRRFARAVGGELLLILGVVALTAVLVAAPPARTTVAPTGPFATTAPIGPLELNLVVDPAVAGSNVMHLYLLDRSGRPATVAEVRVAASLPDRRIGPLHLRVTPGGPGHAIVPSAQLAIAGTWLVRVEARRGEFEQFTQTIPVPIRKER